MPWTTFFATGDDLLILLDRLVFSAGGQAYETYSRFDQAPREFTDSGALSMLAAQRELDGLQLSLLLPGIGAPPRARRIELRPGAVPGHSHRFTVLGCSLLTLQCGRIREGVLEASSLGWWTEASARAKAAPELRADAVDWKRLATVGRRAQRLVRREFACASAGGRPILAGALQVVRDGASLRDPHAPTEQLVAAVSNLER